MAQIPYQQQKQGEERGGEGKGDHHLLYYEAEHAAMYLKSAWEQQFFKKYPLSKSERLVRFFSPENVRYIRDEIQRATHYVLKCSTADALKEAIPDDPKKLLLPMDEAFLEAIYETAHQNVGFLYQPYPVEQVVSFLNGVVVKKETEIMYASILRKLLYRKYFIDQNRMRVFPHARLTKVAKGDAVLDTSGYTLSHPFQRYREEALEKTNGLRQTQEKPQQQQHQHQLPPFVQQQTYKPIPGYLQPKIPAYHHPPLSS